VTFNGVEISSEPNLCWVRDTFPRAEAAALRDRLLLDVPRAFRLVWTHVVLSRERLGNELFHEIVAAFGVAVATGIGPEGRALRVRVRLTWADRG